MREHRIGTKVMWILKALLASYIITGILLVGLALLTYQFEWEEQIVLGVIVAIYVVSTFVGGFILGKLTRVKKYIWGFVIGFLYFAFLTLISYGIYREFSTNGMNVITTLVLCLGGGMLGGMLS